MAPDPGLLLILGKIAFSVSIVLCLSWIVEHVSPRVAGVLSGMPLGAILVLFFVGREHGLMFAADTARFAVPSLLATLCFAGAYLWPARTRDDVSPLLCLVSGLAGYFLAAFLIDWWQPGLVIGAIASFAVLGFLSFHALSQESTALKARVPMTFSKLLFRAGLAGIIIVVITGLSRAIGPEWSGLLIGFPITFLPFILIVHFTYSVEPVRMIIGNFPLGLVSLVIFLLIAAQVIPLAGTNPGILISLCGAVFYLGCLAMAIRARSKRPPKTQI